MEVMPPPQAMFLGWCCQILAFLIPVILTIPFWVCWVFDIYSLCSLFLTMLSLPRRGISLLLCFLSLSAGLLHPNSLLMNVLVQATVLSFIPFSDEVFDAMTSEEYPCELKIWLQL